MHKEFYQAIESGNLLSIKKFIAEYPALLNYKFDSDTPLSIAAARGHLNLVHFFLHKRAKVDGHALSVAVQNNNLDMVKLFLRRNQSIIYSTQHNAQTPLSIALNIGDLNMLNLFFKYGAKVDKQCFGIYLPLSIAIINNHRDVIIYLLKQGASPAAACVPPLRSFFFPKFIDALRQDTTLTEIGFLPPKTSAKEAQTIKEILSRNQTIALLTYEALNCIKHLMNKLPEMNPNQIDDLLALIKQKTDELSRLYPNAVQLQLINEAFIEQQLNAYLLNPDIYLISDAIEVFNTITPENKLLAHNQQRLVTLLFQYFAVVLTSQPSDNNQHVQLVELFFQLKNPDRDLNKLLVHFLAKYCYSAERDEQNQIIHSLNYDLYKLWQACDLNVLQQHFSLEHAQQIMLHLIQQLLQWDNLSALDYQKMLAHLISLPHTHSTSQNDELLLLTLRGLFLAQDTPSTADIPVIKSFYGLLKQTTEHLEDRYISEQDAKQQLCARYRIDDNPVIKVNSSFNLFFATPAKSRDALNEVKQGGLNHGIS